MKYIDDYWESEYMTVVLLLMIVHMYNMIRPTDKPPSQNKTQSTLWALGWKDNIQNLLQALLDVSLVYVLYTSPWGILHVAKIDFILILKSGLSEKVTSNFRACDFSEVTLSNMNNFSLSTIILCNHVNTLSTIILCIDRCINRFISLLLQKGQYLATWDKFYSVVPHKIWIKLHLGIHSCPSVV